MGNVIYLKNRETTDAAKKLKPRKTGVLLRIAYKVKAMSLAISLYSFVLIRVISKNLLKLALILTIFTLSVEYFTGKVYLAPFYNMLILLSILVLTLILSSLFIKLIRSRII